MDRYYILVVEQHYPNQDKVKVLPGTLNSREKAVVLSLNICNGERWDFFQTTNSDPYFAHITEDADGTYTGAIITPKNCLDEWWYAVKIIEVRFGF